MKINKALGIYNIGRMPDKWRKSIVVPFYKKEKKREVFITVQTIKL